MAIFIVLFLVILFICDFALVKFCKVKQHFSLYAFRFLVIVLAVVSLILTGDISFS